VDNLTAQVFLARDRRTSRRIVHVDGGFALRFA
jgi:hypothetical protein